MEKKAEAALEVGVAFQDGAANFPIALEGAASVSQGSERVINFASADHLELGTHPSVRSAALGAIEDLGCSLGAEACSAKMAAQAELEESLARWFGYETALVFESGYAAVLGSLSALADQDTCLILDSWSHARMLDGAFLVAGNPVQQCEIRFYDHLDLASFEGALRGCSRENALVMVESVCALDGREAPLSAMHKLCEQYDTPLVVDESYALGVLGEGGRGLVDASGVRSRCALLLSSLATGLGAQGGAVMGSRQLVDFIRARARSLLFTPPPPVPMVAAALASLGLLEADAATLLEELHARILFARAALEELGLSVAATNSSIVFLPCSGEGSAGALHAALAAEGIVTRLLAYPQRDRAEEGLALHLGRRHGEEAIARLVRALRRHGPGRLKGVVGEAQS